MTTLGKSTAQEPRLDFLSLSSSSSSFLSFFFRKTSPLRTGYPLLSSNCKSKSLSIASCKISTSHPSIHPIPINLNFHLSIAAILQYPSAIRFASNSYYYFNSNSTSTEPPTILFHCIQFHPPSVLSPLSLLLLGDERVRSSCD